MKKTSGFILGLLLSTATVSMAQKFGYCNSSALLTQLPEVKAADSDLKDFQAQLTKKGQEMQKALQTKAQTLQTRQERGEISPKDFEAQAAKLKMEEEDLGKYEQEVYQKLSEKREQLFKPLLDKVNEAMKTVATEQKLSMVFDSGSQILLYADESLDVTKLVKAKLGVAN
jgi:outer membrane protein